MITKASIYDKFSCIAGDCDFNCCSYWKIGVDETTFKTWEKTPIPNGKAPLSSLTEDFKDSHAIRLKENHLCPFFDEDGLCRLVTSYGPSILSETCDSFPRDKKKYATHEEWTLMTSCPAVLDLLKEESSFSLIHEEVNSLEERFRHFAMDLVQRENLTLETAWMIIHYILLDLWEKGASEEENLDKKAEILLSNLDSFLFEDDFETFLECNDLFLDMTENYNKKGLYTSYLSKLIKKAEIIGEYYSVDEETEEEAPIYETYSGKDFKEAFSPYASLLKKWAAARIFESSLLPDDTLEDMIVNIEWIVIQYTLIRHMAYLKYHEDYSLSYKNVRDYIILTGRISGYSEDDINEYMEASFEDSIWDWGYLALLTGM